MAGEGAVSTGAASASKPPKVDDDDDDELDNVPLAVSRGTKASASKVKKEEDDNSDNTPISLSRAKKGNKKQKSATNSSVKASKCKKEENDSYGDLELVVHKKSEGASASARTSKVKKIKDGDLDDVKKMRKMVRVKDESTGTAMEDKVKKERKVYDLPGQKHDPPAERDSLRIFYESLYEQIPTSDMAATWLMEWGLLPLDEARKVFEKKQGQKLKSPVKTTSAKRMPTSPAKKATPSSAKKTVSTSNNTGKTTSRKKRKASSDSDDEYDDFMVRKSKTKRQSA